MRSGSKWRPPLSRSMCCRWGQPGGCWSGQRFDGVCGAAAASVGELAGRCLAPAPDGVDRHSLLFGGQSGLRLLGNPALLLFGRLIHGYGLSNYTTASNAFLADITPPRRRAEAIGLYSVVFDIGLIVGP